MEDRIKYWLLHFEAVNVELRGLTIQRLGDLRVDQGYAKVAADARVAPRIVNTAKILEMVNQVEKKSGKRKRR